jgi:hypothetical protein
MGDAHASGWLASHLLLQPCDRTLGCRAPSRHPLLRLRGTWHHCSWLVPARDALDLSARAALERMDRPSIPPSGTSAGADGDVSRWAAVYGAHESWHPPLWTRLGSSTGLGVADRCSSLAHARVRRRMYTIRWRPAPGLAGTAPDHRLRQIILESAFHNRCYSGR